MSKGGSSLCMLKNLLLGLLMQNCFSHKFNLMTIFFIVKENSCNTKQSSRRLSKEDIKKGLMDSLVYNENIHTKDLHE